MTKVFIVGLGWLGLPLAKHLAQLKFDVCGSVTSLQKAEHLKSLGVHAIVYTISNALPTEITQADCVVFCLPPSAIGGIVKLNAFAHELKSKSNATILFISSTAVYPDNNTVVTEDDARYIVSTHSALVVKEFEDVILRHFPTESTILRFGGLVGAERQPARYFAGKEVSNPQSPINFIHQKDCVAIIAQLIEKNSWGEVFNACAPEHPTRLAYFTKVLQQLHLPLCKASSHAIEKGKSVSSEKLMNTLGYQFIYPNPLDFP